MQMQYYQLSNLGFLNLTKTLGAGQDHGRTKHGSGWESPHIYMSLWSGIFDPIWRYALKITYTHYSFSVQGELAITDTAQV